MLVGWIPPGASVYIHTELPWVSQNANPNAKPVSAQQVFKWLLSEAQTPAERAMVEQEQAYDQSQNYMYADILSDSPPSLGNGAGAGFSPENTLLGWGFIGVDPFAPYGPDGGLGLVIQGMENGTWDTSTADKAAKKEAGKDKQKASFLNQVSAGTNPGPAPGPTDMTIAGVVQQANTTMDSNALLARYSAHQKTQEADPAV